jgi:hypothetical protein
MGAEANVIAIDDEQEWSLLAGEAGLGLDPGRTGLDEVRAADAEVRAQDLEAKLREYLRSIDR